MTTRLPLRVEPLPGEWWTGYVGRVSATYGVHPFSLLRRIYGIDTVDRRHLRWAGIAMPDAVAKDVASTVNLEPSEIQAMHLSAYDGSALRFTGAARHVLGPLNASIVNRLPLADAGALVKATSDRFCPNCAATNPLYRAMSWRLQVHLVCIKHRVLLNTGTSADTAGAGAIHAPIDASIDASIVDSQGEVLDRLAPGEENAAFFDDLDAQLTSFDGDWKRLLYLILQATPHRALDAFQLAVTRVLTPGYPDHQGIGDWSPRAAARHLRPPEPMTFTGPLHCFPHLLPTHPFTRGLSDLLHRAPIRNARAIGALGATMFATGQVLHAAAELLPTRRRVSTSATFLDHLIALEREGRAEQFWSLCAAAAEELIQEGVDYRHRELVCNDEQAYLAATAAEPSAYARTVRTWLVDQWACTYTSSNVRPSVRDGSIEHFDRQFGPGMRAALQRLLQELAA